MALQLQEIIENAWQDRALLQQQETVRAVESIVEQLDLGKIRVASPDPNGNWLVNEWIKKAVILYFPLQKMKVIELAPYEYHDKIELKKGYQSLGVRVVPPAVARYGSFIARGVILMPSYVNIGAYVDEGTMVDTWATVGSCAQIGVRVGKEAVLGSNVCITGSSKIIDVTGEKPIEYRGYVPERSVVIPGSYAKKFPAGEFHVPCALIIGKRKESTDLKTSLNQALRDNDVAV
jgi:2,3,4,5-tetrahydropyridine-2-carboxylate N-succinyltransferase